MAFRATAEPRLIKLMTTPQRNETMTALRGMGKFGETFGFGSRGLVYMALMSFCVAA